MANKIIDSTSFKIKFFALLSLVLCFVLFGYYKFQQPALIKHDYDMLDEINKTLQLLEDKNKCAKHLKVMSHLSKKWPISILSANGQFRLEADAQIGPYHIEQLSLDILLNSSEIVYADLILEMSQGEYRLRKQVPLSIKNFKGSTFCQSYMRPIR